MEPAYKPGERILTFNWKKPRVGDVVVFSDLTSLRVEFSRRGNLKKRLLHFVRNDKKEFMIKRIDKIEGHMFFVSGDNKKMTSKVGPIKQDQIIGKVILKY